MLYIFSCIVQLQNVIKSKVVKFKGNEFCHKTRLALPFIDLFFSSTPLNKIINIHYPNAPTCSYLLELQRQCNIEQGPSRRANSSCPSGRKGGSSGGVSPCPEPGNWAERCVLGPRSVTTQSNWDRGSLEARVLRWAPRRVGKQFVSLLSWSSKLSGNVAASRGPGTEKFFWVCIF